MATLPTVALGDGSKIPMIGYGTGTAWFKDPEADIDRATVDAIKTAIAVGYRHIDAAQMYGTEGEVGVAMKESGIPRSEIFLTTKAVSPTDVEDSLEVSLKKLQTEYVDLFLLHEPFSSKSTAELQEAWKALERCHARGLARNIGVSNCLIPHLEAILEVATIKPALNQVEFHPYLQRVKLRAYLEEKKINFAGFAALSALTKASPGPVDDVCHRLAKKYGVSEGVICLRWAIEQQIPVITTSGKQERLQEYLKDVPGIRLTKDEVEEISQIGSQKSFRGFFTDPIANDCFD